MSDKHDEKAREIITAIRSAVQSGYFYLPDAKHEFTTAIASSLRQVERETLERAAKVCEKRASLDESEYDSYLESMNSGDIAAASSDRESRGCAAAIRALIESEKVQP